MNKYLFALLFLIITTVKNAVFQLNFKESGPLIYYFENIDLNELNQINQSRAAIEAIIVNNFQSTYLPENAFNSKLTKSLKHLKLSGRLRTMHSNALQQIQQLTELDLSHNRINHIPNDFFVPITRTLNKFNISHNQLTSPTLDTFYKLNDATSIDLSHNIISELILGVLDEASNVKYLYLSYNRIGPKLELGILDELVKLIELDLSYNRIAVLPLGIFDRSDKIERLNLDGNDFPDGFQLGVFDSLKHLKELTLSNNNMKTIQLGLFDENTKLIRLDLSGNNQIPTIHQGLFNYLNNLQLLNVSRCNFTQLPHNLFDQNTHLTSIDLSHNKLEHILVSFDRNQRLNALNLSHNRIHYLEYDNQIGIRLPVNLERLDLRYNRIVFIDEAFFGPLNNLRTVEIVGNPWHCKCLDKILSLFDRKQIKFEKSYYFEGDKPLCVAFDLLNQCTMDKANLTVFYEYYMNYI